MWIPKSHALIAVLSLALLSPLLLACQGGDPEAGNNPPGTTPPTTAPAPEPQDTSASAPNNTDTQVASKAPPDTSPPAPPPNPAGVTLKPLSGPGLSTSVLNIPGGLATRDIMDAGRSTNGKKIACLIRPGDMIIVTEDEGQTWSVVPQERTIVEMAPGNRLWWGLGPGSDPNGIARRLMRSRDGGKKFSQHATLEPLILTHHRLLRTHKRSVFFVVEEHLITSTNRGETWKFSDPGLERDITALHIDASGRRWFGADAGAAARSTGKRRKPFQRIDLPKSVGPILDFTSHPKHPTLAVTRTGLWRLQDQDEPTWTRIEAIGKRALHGARYLNDTQVIAFGPSGRALLSKDAGTTWHDLTELILFELALDPQEALSLHWRFAEPISDGVLLLGDQGAVLKIAIP